MKVVRYPIKGSGTTSGSNPTRRRSAGVRKKLNLKGTGDMKRKKMSGKQSHRKIRRRKGRKGGLALKERKALKGMRRRSKKGRGRRKLLGQVLQMRLQQGRVAGADVGLLLGGALLGNWLGGLATESVASAARQSVGSGSKALGGLGLWALSQGVLQWAPGVLRGWGGKRLLEGSAFAGLFGAGVAGLKWLGEMWPWFGANVRPQAGIVAGPVVGLSLLTKADLERKIDELKGERDELEAALGGVAGDLSPEQEAVYVSAAEHVASVEGPLRAASKLLEAGRQYEAGEAIKDAMSLAIVGRALLSGLTAGVAMQMPGAAQMQRAQQLPAAQMPAAQAAPMMAAQQQRLSQAMAQGGQGLADVVQIQDEQSGEVQAVPAPSAEQVTVQTASGAALNLDGLAQWATWVSQTHPGWSPSEVATAFILKYLANNGHYYGYGPNAVVAQNNWFPNVTMGYSNVTSSQQVLGVRLTTGGQMLTCGGSADEILATVSGVFEHHFGLH